MNDSIHHHPSEEILFAYSAGTLPEAFNLMIASHLSLCDHCRALVESFDAVGGAVIDAASTPTAALSDGALSSVLDRLDAPAPLAPGLPQ